MFMFWLATPAVLLIFSWVFIGIKISYDWNRWRFQARMAEMKRHQETGLHHRFDH